MERVKPNTYLKQLTLLYVEDEASIREPFEMMLKRYFKNVYVGKNGSEGLELFKTYQEEIDVIISDIKMPVMTGLEMAQNIKEINYEIPLIFTTAFGDSDYLKSAIDVGADGYIIKPIDRNKVFAKLNTISSSIKAKKEVYQYLKLIETLFNYQTDGIILLDENLDIKIENKTFKKLLSNVDVSEIKNINQLFEYYQTEEGDEITREYFVENIGNKFVCKDKSANKYFEIDVKKVENYILINVDDITQYKLEQEAIQEHALTDALTGAYNRKKLELVQNELKEKNVCLIMFDIDNFKSVNDTYGHLKGDEVLKRLSETIQHNIRESDLFVRWGGEEFIVLLKGLTDVEIARTLAEKLRLKITKIEIEEVGHFSCSFGVSCGFISESEDMEKIINNADEALYTAKRTGKNKVVVSEK